MWSFGFGLVHGFGFASATGMALVRGLVGFNAGLEIGQLLFVISLCRH
ncbi:MAG: HupE/UreJ family protein [Bradyrhizobium sp.]